MSFERSFMHPVLQAAIDNPRLAEPYALSLGEIVTPLTRSAQIVKPNYLPMARLLSDETLVPTDSHELRSMARHTFTRRDGTTVNGAPLTGTPANDNVKGTPWPLYDEYVAERLGNDAASNGKNWNTALWIDKIYHTATLSPVALGPPHWIVGGLTEEEEDGYETVDVIPPEVVAVLAILEKAKQAKSQKPGPSGSHEVDISRDPSLPTGVEIRADANKILRTLQVGMRGLWQPVKKAIVDHSEMWRLGISHGASRALAPTAGRQRVLDGLEFAADIRKDIKRWEALSGCPAVNTCSPFGLKGHDIPATWRAAANDDTRQFIAA